MPRGHYREQGTSRSSHLIILFFNHPNYGLWSVDYGDAICHEEDRNDSHKHRLYTQIQSEDWPITYLILFNKFFLNSHSVLSTGLN